MKKTKREKKALPATEKRVNAFLKEREKTLTKNSAFTPLQKIERDYLLSEFKLFEEAVKLMVTPEMRFPAKHKKYRYTPQQMLDNILLYFRRSLELGQPLTLRGIGLFCGIKKSDFSAFINKPEFQDIPEFDFIHASVEFVEMYIEFTGQKKQNPAFAIFWLKNRGWKDKFEIDSTNSGMTDDERREAQARIKNSTE